MDRRIRAAERTWQGSGSLGDLNRLLVELLRLQSLEDWELSAERGDSQATRYIDYLRRFARDDDWDEFLENSEVYINVYEDFTARTTIPALPKEITEVRRWIRDFYANNQTFYSGREVYDISLQREVQDPPAVMVINYDVGPCFRFYPQQISRRAEQFGIEEDYEEENLTQPAIIRSLSPINRWGQRDHYVGFHIIDSYDEAPSAPEPDRINRPHHGEDSAIVANLPQWINAYQVGRFRGGSEEGGWYFNAWDPLASIYLGSLPAGIDDTHEFSIFRTGNTAEAGYYAEVNPNITTDQAYSVPAHLETAISFLAERFAHITHGDIYSVNGGGYLDLRVQTHPALREPFYRPYYC